MNNKEEFKNFVKSELQNILNDLKIRGIEFIDEWPDELATLVESALTGGQNREYVLERAEALLDVRLTRQLNQVSTANILRIKSFVRNTIKFLFSVI